MDDNTLDCMNAFLSAAGNVLGIALEKIEVEVPGAQAGVQRMTDAGAIFSISARIGSLTRIAQVQVQITSPSGQSHMLLLAELHDAPQAHY